MSAIVELSDKPCHFCGQTGANYKAKVKSQELQAVLCDEHLKEVLKQEQSSAEIATPSLGQGADGGRNRRTSAKGNTADDERTVTT